MSVPGCGVRTSSYGWSAIFFQKPRPGLLGRPARCRPALPVHEREAGLLPDCRDGTRARRVQGGLLCLAATATVRPRHGRRGLVEAYQDRACQFAAESRARPAIRQDRNPTAPRALLLPHGRREYAPARLRRALVGPAS